jgi:glycosyltransferase involved in cell wall biosynthesis
MPSPRAASGFPAAAAMGRVALVHDWLVGWGGSERVLEVLAGMFPEAPIFTAVWSPDSKVREVFGDHDVRPTVLQGIPGSSRHYPKLLPLMAWAFRSLDLSDFDVVISSSHAFSKSVRRSVGARHVCYCHSPPRYLWDLYRTYSPGWRGVLGAPLARFLRRQDVAASRGVDRFVANSRTVADRIRRHYGKDAVVVHPPVDVASFMAAGRGREPEDWFLTGGRMVRYKRMDVLVRAATVGGFSLKVFGDGPERRGLQELAGPGVEFLGPVEDGELASLMSRCRAFLFAAEEDFGILPVEAQAAGRPVVAWGRGGATETVVHGETGILVEDGSPECFARAALDAGRRRWDRKRLQSNAARFKTDRFVEEMASILRERGGKPGPLDSGIPVDDV